MAQNRIVVPVPAPRNFQWSWREIALAAIVLIATGVLVYSGVNWVVSHESESTSTTAEVEQPSPVSVAQPVQQAPEAIAPVVITFRIRAEGPWVEVGTMRNGPEGRALPIPWDQLVMKMTPENKALVLEIEKLDLPPAANIPNVNPVRGWSGYLQAGNKIMLYAYSNYRWSTQDPQVLSYWKREATIEGSNP